jgi:hypothetical protein
MPTRCSKPASESRPGIVSDLTIRADRDVVDPLARQSSDVSPLGASRAGLRLVRPSPTGC